DHKVVVLDSRGQGRSNRFDKPITYRQMASDVLELMNHLNIKHAALVGWSDGAIIGLEIAIHHPKRLSKLFAYGANADASGVKEVTKMPAFKQYLVRVKKEYKKLSPVPDRYHELLDSMSKLWSSVHFTAE